MARINASIAPLTERDEADIRALLHARAMNGPIRLATTRDPSFQRALATEGDRHDVMMIRDEQGYLVGMGGRSVYDAYVHGEKRRIGYLGQFRVNPGRSGLRRLLAAFDAIGERRLEDELPFDITCILADNRPAIRLLERGLKGLPRYHRLRPLITLVVPTGQKVATRARQAEPADLPEIIDCLARHHRTQNLAPAWSAHDLSSDERCRDLRIEDFLVLGEPGALRACAAVWDQRAFKQISIQSYAPWLRVSRPLVNAGLLLAGKPRLPRAPGMLDLAYLSHLACDLNRPDDLIAIVAAALALAERKGLGYLVLTLAEDHAFAAILKRRFRYFGLSSWLYLVDWDQGRKNIQAIQKADAPWLEAALL